jgi:hypothetical protein
MNVTGKTGNKIQLEGERETVKKTLKYRKKVTRGTKKPARK